MPLTPIITNENAVNRAALLQTTLGTAVCRLLKDYQPLYTDNRAILLSHEANFTGYPNGGYNTGNWVGPALPPGGGAVITPAVINVIPAGNNVIQNNISGFWVETTANNVTNTWMAGAINPPIAVTVPTDQFPLLLQDWEGLVAAPAVA